EAQQKLDDIVMNHFDHVTTRSKDEMDKFLVYVSSVLGTFIVRSGFVTSYRQATLFSAILTAFNVESYKLFRESLGDPDVILL
ncbi:hypothetical protein BD413DRAFT_457966, partial [Trametes elegans]